MMSSDLKEPARTSCRGGFIEIEMMSSDLKEPARTSLLPITHYPLPITHYPLPITYYLLPITHYPLPNNFRVGGPTELIIILLSFIFDQHHINNVISHRFRNL
jgi:hypothetical protein